MFFFTVLFTLFLSLFVHFSSQSFLLIVLFLDLLLVLFDRAFIPSVFEIDSNEYYIGLNHFFHQWRTQQNVYDYIYRILSPNYGTFFFFFFFIFLYFFSNGWDHNKFPLIFFGFFFRFSSYLFFFFFFSCFSPHKHPTYLSFSSQEQWQNSQNTEIHVYTYTSWDEKKLR